MMFRSFGVSEFLLLTQGLLWTAVLAAAAFVGSAVLGLLLLLVRTGQVAALRILALSWVQVIQGTPLLGLLFLSFFGFALFGIDVSRWIAAVVALSIYGSAFLADIWRGAILGVPHGQWEAATALGLTRMLRLRLVILPQAFTIAIAPTVGFLVQLVKNTSLASVIGLTELSREAQLVNGATFAPFIVYACAAGLYLCLCTPLTVCSRALERRREVAR
jgi:polar amino acid transport system permease protein